MRGRFRERSLDHQAHAFQVAQDIVVPEPQHFVSAGAKERVTLLIAEGFGMLSAIGLDNEPMFAAYEIHNVGPDGLLPDEFGAGELSISQTRP